jgi:hypothetical protein
MTSVGSIVGGGFRLIRERPVAVAIWAVLYAVVGFATQIVVMRMMTVPGSVLTTRTEEPDPQAVLGMFGSFAPIYLLAVLLGIVLACAAYRAVLRPSEGGIGFLRIGMDELRMLGLLIIFIVAAIIGTIVFTLLLAMVAGALMLAAGSNSMAAIGLGFLLYLAVFCVVIWVYVRLSLIFSLTFARRRISIDGAWSLTRGRFWTLFGAYFVIGVIVFVVAIAVALPFAGPYFAGIMEGMRNPEAMQQIQAQQAERQLNQPFAIMALSTVLNAIFQALILAVGAGATATATRELLLDSGEVLEEDADRTAAIFE